MKTNFIHSVLTFLVVLSLFAPAVMPFVNASEDAIVLLDLTEEDQKKESKKELEEKEVYFLDHLGNYGYLESNDVTASFYYQESHFEVSTEILLPPPEGLG